MMSSYTTQLKTIVEQSSQYEEGLSLNEKIEIGRKSLFDFEYPIFDESYKKVFETNFIKNFYMREIGFETEGLFKFRLETWLQIHLPYYNKLFESEKIKFDPLINSKTSYSENRNKNKDKVNNKKSNYQYDRNYDDSGNKNSDINSTSNSDMFTRDIESDTPDSRLQLTTQDGKGVIEYASGIDEKTGNENSSGNSLQKDDFTSSGSDSRTSNTNDDFTSNDLTIEDILSTREGKIGDVTYSEMIMKYRDSLIRIEKTMFEEMNELFMLVY